MVKLYGGGLRLKHVQTSEIFEFVNIWLIDMPYYCTKTHFVFFADFSFFLSLIGGLGSRYTDVFVCEGQRLRLNRKCA